jgi:hypothetical protein
VVLSLFSSALDLSTGALPQWHDFVDETVADNLAFDLTEDLRILRALTLLDWKLASIMVDPEPDFSPMTAIPIMM